MIKIKNTGLTEIVDNIKKSKELNDKFIKIKEKIKNMKNKESSFNTINKE